MNKIIPTLFIAGLALLAFNISDAKAQYGLTIDPDTLMPTDTATAELCAGITSLKLTGAYLVDPAGTTHTTAVNIGTELSPGDCATWIIPNDFSSVAVPLTPGSWALVVDTAQGNPFVKDFAVTFFVLPETAIGAIGIVGASIAGMSIYLYRKRNI